MKRAWKAILWLAALAAILFGGWAGMRIVQSYAAEAQATPPEADRRGPVQVAVRTVEMGTLSASVWATGEVSALQSADVASKISGRLERLRLPDGTRIEEGAEVEAGQAVAVVEHRQLAAAVRSAEAALEAAKAARETAKVNAADALRERERWAELRRGGSGTQQQLDMAATAHERAQAQLKQAEAQIAQAEAALEQAGVNLDEATVKAPFSGVVTRKHVDEGAFVGPAAPLFRLADISQVEIACSVAGRHFPHIQPGKTRAVAEVDAYPGEAFEGAVSRVRPELDRITRTAAVTVRLPNPELKLKPGMFARVRLALEERENVPVVPESALVRKEGRTLVYAVENGHVRVREVRIGLQEAEMVEVLEGAAPGDRVVVRGHQSLSDGMAVEPVKVEEAR